MKISFSTLGTPAYSLDDAIRLAVTSGYDGIELRVIEGSTDLPGRPEFSTNQIGSTAQRFTAAALEVPSVATGVHVGGDESAELSANVDEARAFARIAAGLRSPFIRVFAGPEKGDTLSKTRAQAIARGLTVVAEAIGEFGVVPIVETHGTLSTSSALAEVLSFADSDAIGVLWDVMHSWQNGESIAQSTGRLEGRIKHVHLRDVETRDPKTHDYVLTGEGVAPFSEIVETLQRQGFDGYLSFEWEKFWIPELEEPEIVIPQFATYMRESFPNSFV